MIERYKIYKRVPIPFVDGDNPQMPFSKDDETARKRAKGLVCGALGEFGGDGEFVVLRMNGELVCIVTSDTEHIRKVSTFIPD